MAEYFKISTGLKTLIGSELITDNFVAVFELVKNSFDANASLVEIRFENIDTDNGRIVIIDNGKGMDYDDLINKWLFVAYSAKKDGTEDGGDYRNKIVRNYGGAKGVGRFSCDRLGRYLNLISVKNVGDSQIENLFVDWTKFEINQKEEFDEIPIEHQILKKTKYNISHGTVLEISGIRKEEWTRESLLKLKDRLSKLIRPDLNKSERGREFKILLSAHDHVDKDLEIISHSQNKGKGWLYRNTVNGNIENFIFEDLDIRTTRIESVIAPDGKSITTKLVDRERDIYTIKETNKYDLLGNISIGLYFLNRSAKIIFKRRMGVDVVQYGNVFIYKNGFRVYPYGERGDDSLGLDNRALQGYSRFIGLRNLSGQIEINGPNSGLRETTSRDGGLVKTRAYEQLVDFIIYTLKRLEKYVVEVTEWGVNEDIIADVNDKIYNENIVKLLSNISEDKSILDIQYNRDISTILLQQEENSAKKLVGNFKRIAAESNNQKLYKDAQLIEKKMSNAVKDRESAVKQFENAVVEKKHLQIQLEIEKDKNLYLSSSRKVISEDAEGLIHGIKFNLVEIDELVNKLLGEVSERNLTKKELIKGLSDIKFFSEKTLKVAQLITRANYKQDQENQFVDIPTYLKEYLGIYNDIFSENNLAIKVVDGNAKLKKWVSILDITILLDNLISNSIKWKKSKDKKTVIQVSMNNQSPDKLEIIFSDNGVGLSKKFYKYPNKIFELGVTESKGGSGIGLHTVIQILERINGEIEFVGNSVQLDGATFKITIKK